MDEVANYLRSGKTPEDIKLEYSIKFRRHGLYPNLISFSYDQFASDMSLPICREARGIVLDEADNWRCVCRPFEKFFNLGEPNAAKIRWEDAWVEPKLDGSMICMWWYRDGWEFSTTGTPDAEASVDNFGETFRDKFIRCLESKGIAIPPAPHLLYIESPWRADIYYLTYIFEFMDGENPIVVRHEKTDIALLGIRDNHTGDWRPKILPPWFDGVEIVRPLAIPATVESVVEAASLLNGFKDEGFVIIGHEDGYERIGRIKVKSPDYLMKHRFKYAITEERLMDVAKTGETEEIVSTFPELAGRLETMKSALMDYADLVDTKYLELMAKMKKDFSRKEFALAASGDMAWIMFKMLDRNSDAMPILRETDSKKLLRLVDGR